MGFSKHHIRFAAELLSGYSGQVPLSVFLKQFFAGQKKFGSRDRREIGALCYQYFRLGHLATDFLPAERLLIAVLLFHSRPHEVLAEIKPEWLDAASLPFDEKLSFVLGKKLLPQQHTPFHSLLQPQTGGQSYVSSFFHQPDLFIRIRPAADHLYKALINVCPGAHATDCPDVFSLPNGTNTEELGVLNRDFVIQDLSSRKSGNIIREVFPDLKGNLWDCCAASGGKTIMLYDTYGKHLHYTVSDIRSGILHNLRERLKNAGINRYQLYQANLEQGLPHTVKQGSMDVILADVPCTGSGTWARTPEQHYFFKPEQLNSYVSRQQAICTTVLPALKSGGTYIYITCSVFEAENDGMARFLEEKCSLNLIESRVIDGIPYKADSMYIALFTKP